MFDSTSHWRRIPWVLVLCTAALLGIGLSAIQRGDEVSGLGEYFGRQMLWIGIAVPVLIATASLNYRVLSRHSLWLFLLAIVFLVVVFAFRPINGARRWIPLGFFNFQPSEMAKLTFILALAAHLRFQRNYRTLSGLVAPFAMSLVPMGLILKEPNLGTSLLFLPILFAMLFAAGARLRHLGSVVAVGIAVLPVVWMGMSAEQQSRVTALFLQRDGGPTPQGDSYHLHQSKQVLALGGMWGSQITGQIVDDPAAYHLPESRTDFVFCMVGERWGLAGCLVTLALYVVLFARGLMIAGSTHEPFGRLVAVGVVTLLATQTIVNTAMTVGLAPITGLTLPLLSLGGSSLLTTCIAIGLLISVHAWRGYEIAGEPFRFADG